MPIEDRIKDFADIWKDASFNFPYWQAMKLDWNQAFKTSLSAISQGQTEREHYLQLMAFISLLNDGHSMIYLPKQLREAYGSYPIQLKWLDHQIIIERAEPKYQDYLNQPIKMINGLPAALFMKTCISPYCWHEKLSQVVYEFNTIGPFILAGQDLQLTYEDKVLTIPSLSEKAIQWSSIPENNFTQLIATSDEIEIGLFEQNIAYVRIHSFLSEKVVETFYQALSHLKKCHTLIFDVRDNRGGNSGYADKITQAFFTEKIVIEKYQVVKHESEKYANGSHLAYTNQLPSNKTERENLENYQHLSYQTLYSEIEDAQQYEGVLKDLKVYLLQNTTTYSSAENFLMNFDATNRGILVGETSAGSTGQALIGRLSSGGAYTITSKAVTYPDGKEYHNLGVVPQIQVIQTLNDRQQEKDSQLEAILTLIKDA